MQIESKLIKSKNTYNLSIGQGLSDYQIYFVCNNVSQNDFKDRFRVTGHLCKAVRAKNELTHKRYTYNSMISDPVKLYENNFLSFLMVDDNCAEMSDHSTGQHIQGMILIESARQMINAVAEKFLISPDISSLKGFVLNGIESNFKQYVFPLEATLCLELLNIKNGLNGDFKADGAIKIFQNNVEMCSVDISFSVADKNILSAIERGMAEKYINLNKEYFPKSIGGSPVLVKI